MRYEKQSEMNFLIDGVVGTRDHIKRMLLTKGMSELSVDELMDKVEIIIGLSGQLGKLVQRDKDMDELRKMRLALHEMAMKRNERQVEYETR